MRIEFDSGYLLINHFQLHNTMEKKRVWYVKYGILIVVERDNEKNLNHCNSLVISNDFAFYFTASGNKKKKIFGNSPDKQNVRILVYF